MDINTAIGIVSDAGYPIFEEYGHRCSLRAFHSMYIYDLAFGQTEADVSPYVNYMKKHDLTKGKRIMELFGGTAFESYILHEKFPDNAYCSADLFTKSAYSSVRHISANLLYGVKKVAPLQDMLFIGDTNKSLCTVLNVRGLEGLFEFASLNTKKDGHFIVSGFEDNAFSEQIDYKVDFDVSRIKYLKLFSGMWAHTAMLIKRDPFEQKHFYFPLVILSKTKVIRSDKDVCFYFAPDDYGEYKSWPYGIVVEIAARYGFVLTNKDAGTIDFMTFKHNA